MGRDTVQLETAVSTISQEYLLEFTSEYGISEDLHPELPGPEERNVDFPKGKSFRDQLSRPKHSPTLNLFRVFYIPSFNSRWMSFSKRPGKNTPQCYTKPLDSLKNWNNRFFWVDERVFPTVVNWRTSASKDEMPAKDTYSAEAVTILKTHRTPIQKQSEALLCLVGLSRRYFLRDDVYLTFLHDDDRDRSFKGAAVAVDSKSKNTSFTSMVGSPESIYQPEWGVTNGCRLDAPEACQDLVDHIARPMYFSELHHLHNDDFLKQYNINLARQVAMGSQLRLRFEQEAKLLKKSVAQVARRDQSIQARENEIKNLEALLEDKTDMKKTAEAKNTKIEIVGRRWVIRNGLRLAVMKCEHGKANLDLEGIEAYDPEAETKYAVRGPKDHWAFKEEILLADAIAANVSHAENKKKCRVVCRTHRVDSVHHARSDGVLVSVPTIAPQGLVILLADPTTKMETFENGASPRLLRSNSLPVMHNLD
nr:hypothetical protein [Tanacetum cinerariifolium]